MIKITKFSKIALGLFLTLGLIGLFSTTSQAATFTLDHCSGGCGVTGTVTVTDNGTDTLHFIVQSPDFLFVNSTSHGDNFLFNIGAVSGGNGDNPTVTFSNFTAGWRANQADALTTESAGSHGGGGWTFEYSVTCHFAGGLCEGNGASTPANPPLEFDITASGLTVDSFNFAGGGTTAIFAADVIGATNTGLIGATPDETTHETNIPTPESNSFVLVGASLTLLALLGKVRRSATAAV
jgi:hypothetical protein